MFIIPVERFVGFMVPVPVVKCVMLVFWYVHVEETSDMIVAVTV